MQIITLAGSINPISEPSVMNYAANMFYKALATGLSHKFMAILTRRTSRLLDLGSHPPQMKNSRYAGQREVMLDDIRGTEGRQNDFDDRFNPLTERIRQR